MKNWLAKVRPPKYLRYLFFIGYSWYRRFKSERIYAENNIIIFLASCHGVAYLGIFFLIFKPKPGDSSIVFITMGIVAIQFYIWFSYKSKWKKYAKEFQHIARKKQKRHVILIFLYFIICIQTVVLPILLDELFGINLYE